MTLSGCSITKETAACFKGVVALIFVFCFVLAPYPYCYYLDSKEEDALQVRLFFKKNDFYNDCSKTNNMFLDTDKDVVIYLDGKQNRTIKKGEGCLKGPAE